MADKPNEDTHQKETEYDTRDAEVPIAIHNQTTDAHEAHAHKETKRARHYIGTAVGVVTDKGRWIGRNIFANDRMWEILATITIAAATVLYTHYAKKQWSAIDRQLPELQKSANAAHEAAEIAAKQYETSERPWVDADIKINGPLTFNVNGASLPVVFILRNSGHSPAFGTFVNPRIVIMLGGSDPVTARNQACTDAKRATGMTLGITIFPNVTFQQPEDVGIPKQDIEKAIAQFPTFNGSFVGPTLVACISYRPTFNKTSFYTTAYIAQLFKVPRPGQVNAAFKPSETVDAAHLLLRFSPMNAIEAN